MNFQEIRDNFFPVILPSGVVAKPVDDDEMFKAMTALLPTIFHDGGESCHYHTPLRRQSDLTELWNKYNEGHHEKIVFYNRYGEAIGLLLGDMEDHMTFYLRVYGLVAEYRRQGIFRSFQLQFYKYIEKLGYERVASHHKINNRAALISQLKVGYNLTGFELDERFGPLAKLVYFIHPDRQISYEETFD